MTANSILVFIVEDDPMIREMLSHDLADAGFSVVVTCRGKEAIKMLDDGWRTCRALLTDINLLDDITGWDVAWHARVLNADMPVIYMTGNAANDWEKDGVPNSVMITKPFDIAQIIATISRLLNASDVV